MPRRESYRTDDEDDDLRRRASASGGGLPAWVWLIGGGGVLAMVVVAGLGFAFFTSRREAVRADFARAEVMRAEADHQPIPPDQWDDEPVAEVPRLGGDAKELKEVSLTQFLKVYQNNPAAADATYTGTRLRLRLRVSAVGDGWVGASGALEPGRPAPATPNVIVEVPAADGGAAVGATVVVEATCDGLVTDPETGPKLMFSRGHFVRR